jgi:hypothetical protein
MLETAGSTKRRAQWIILMAAFTIIIALTIYKDWALTGNRPNVWFYVLVPPVSILGSALTGYGIIKAGKFPITFWGTLFIVTLSDFWGQVFENVSKLIYYLLCPYPGWLYFIGLLPFIFVVPGYMLTRWYKLRWYCALLIALAILIGGTVFGLGFSAITGIDTPGS